ncbi:hypothetical protein MKZ38_009282 [Zalerion maritima]|uniref:Uncharacterized protein n=1 Tax=Zalerion maritima TaxID=339359 RepID=A0AAD5RUX6_9PEZI|nr:hypothetical protein MKZ38_009282 [Zalerion maritima]
MDHLPWLLERSAETGGDACGHALMASCPLEPLSDLSGDIPFGYSNMKANNAQQQKHHRHQHNNSSHMLTPTSAGGNSSARGYQHQHQHHQEQQPQQDEEPAQRTRELSKGDLSTLLDLSKRLNLDGEITPVMAWGMILSQPGVNELASQDFAQLAEVLKGKVRCYGFGAVMEDFEVRDAIENVFSTKPELCLNYKPEPIAMAF